ncbi:sigma-54-dependent Fis family transcriptional regulator [Halalkalibacter nanhaiisediminis]|uniref:Transcriptional regulator of acetoin/glycerol metabolism n=1 Tax=Halalkalibacter nanhaiisediminis TaxID=688079 RepID=A0A562QT96_9BACI|nr:sigma-54-dependent Fis family transcriptional regulator [Halalkalibacter nanhaiisediminis]TWI59998.1 transcriptional regulator of acetoin/glycerol metabolism [Halalkalibacter nanhaiisediminis]
MSIIADKKWKQFVLEGRTDIDIRKNVLDSWKRCKQLGVSHDREEVFSRVSQLDFVQRRQQNSELIHAALPVMQDLYKRLKGGGYLLLLADAEGYLVEMVADRKSQTIADRSGISIGARWKEENVGSTGLSIAIQTKTAMATSGNEHFCLALRTWDCSACPIFVDGKFVGAFDVCRMGPGNDLRELSTLAVAGAHAVSERYKFNLMKSKEQVLSHLLSEYTHKFTKNTGIITFNKQGIELYKNEYANDFFKILKLEAGNESLVNFIKKEPMEIEVEGKRYLLNREEVRNMDEELATVIFIKPQNIVTVSKIVNNQDEPVFDSKNLAFQKTIKTAIKAAKSDACILIQGESGVGKDFMARFIHKQSNRRNNPYTAINCAAISRDLITSELFGYEGGAFTGAKPKGSQGKIEASNHGTIFLDEIADLPLDLQATLLRTLEEKHVVRVGGTTAIPVDVRFLAATNKNLKELVEKGEFREDLYYRLNVFHVKIPALRDRMEDFETIFTSIIATSCKKAERKMIEFTPEAIHLLQQYSWSGNLRELRNVIERIVYLHDEDHFTENDVQEYINLYPSNEKLDEQEYLSYILRKSNGNRAQAAREIGISRSALYRKLQKYKIE